MSEIKQNKFFRIIYTFLFAMLFCVMELVVCLVAIVQSLLFLFTGEPSASLKKFGASLAIFVEQLIAYVSFKHDDKPFPFSDWPSDKPDVLQENSDQQS